jgi:DNA topoisomerase VI subunit B
VSAQPNAPQVLNRAVFVTSRELEYFTAKELTLQTGHEPERWPEVILKELVDNGLDACEGAGVAPEISIAVAGDTITVTDNGPGLPASVIESVIDYSVRASSKDAYISPTRGAQGNALKTILAIPYVLSGETGTVTIDTPQASHRISVSTDRIAQAPRIEHTTAAPVVKIGTSVTVWARSQDSATVACFLQMVEDYSLLNPHATFEFEADGATHRFERTTDAISKWKASEPTDPHWYTPDQLRNLMAAYLTLERNGGHARTVREFISEFRGLSATTKQKAILGQLGLSNVPLSEFVKGGDVDMRSVTALLAQMQEHSKPVKPALLGVVGREHFERWFATRKVVLRTFKYNRSFCQDKSGRPAVLEIGVAVREASDRQGLRLVTGVNFAPTLVDPFRALAGYGVGLQGLLGGLYIEANDPVTLVCHLTCPHLNYTDRGKSSLEAL